MQDPGFRPPLPTPDGQILPPAPQTYAPGEWQSAPPVVKSWAYPITWLAIVFLPLALIGLNALRPILGAAVVPLMVFNAALLVAQIYMNRALKKCVPAAWNLQIVLSIVVIASQAWSLATNGGRAYAGIIGIAIHAYILSQWFKPEVKAWFGRN